MNKVPRKYKINVIYSLIKFHNWIPQLIWIIWGHLNVFSDQIQLLEDLQLNAKTWNHTEHQKKVQVSRDDHQSFNLKVFQRFYLHQKED